jgi:crotonobetainyl-CoA:carnitine CoA-transferase CaiB-like acyl-CoA transferase
VSGAPTRRWGNAHPQIVPYQVFASADGYLTVAAGNDKLFGSLCWVLGREDLATDARYDTNPRRVANRSSLIAELDAAFGHRTSREWLQALQGVQVPCGPVASLEDLLDGSEPPPGVEMMTLETDGEAYRTIGSPVTMAGRRHDLTAAPRVGEHTDQVLGGWLGIGPERLAQLREAGVIQ